MFSNSICSTTVHYWDNKIIMFRGNRDEITTIYFYFMNIMTLVSTGNLYHLRLRVECTLFCNFQSRARTHAVLVIGLYECVKTPKIKSNRFNVEFFIELFPLLVLIHKLLWSLKGGEYSDRMNICFFSSRDIYWDTII
jgi:hypothetical protein